MNVAGPYTARFFAELGADVVHVEPPYGDDGRNGGPPFLFPEGGLYAVGNRNKRGLVLNIKTPGGSRCCVTCSPVAIFSFKT